VAFSNIDEEDMTIFYLVKQGYGTRSEIEQWDTTEFLDAVEYERIQKDIEWFTFQGK